ncbi:MAG: HIT domain-containing protein [Phycisphaerales bacterium]|nr:HIT domain-containing protein [Planctomycetota bacterium]
MNIENLWAPWRMAYLRELQRRADALGKPELDAGPFLTDYWQNPQEDDANHVIYRNEHGLILLNRYPYASGHLLAALGDPRPTLLDYEPDQRAELWKLLELGTDLLQRTLHPQGINMGINQGRAAGAGVPEHLHAHLVPRWHGDTNFISVVGQIRVMPESLDVMAGQFRTTLEQVLKTRRSE